MKKLSVAVVSSFVFGALAVLSAQADTWYLKSDVSSGSYPATTGDNAGEYWKNVKDDQPGSGPLNPEDTYWIRDGYQLRMSNTPFPGGGLTVGNVDNPDYASSIALYANVSIPNGPLVWAAGYIFHSSQSSSKYSIQGKGGDAYLTSPKERPFGLTSTKNSTRLTLPGKLIGEADTGIVLGGRYDGEGFVYMSVTNMVFSLADLSEFKGLIHVLSDQELISPTGAKTIFNPPPNDCPGSLEMDAGSELQTDAIGELSFESLTFHAGSRYSLRYDATARTSSLLRAETFVIPESEGQVFLRFSATPIRDATGDVTVPVLVVPDTQELDASRFSLTVSDSSSRLEVVTDDVAHTKTLVAVCGGKVRLVTGDSDVYNKTSNTYDYSALTSALAEGKESSWSDGVLPHDGFVYEFGSATGSGTALRTPYDRSEDYVFPGSVLRAIGSKARLVLADSSRTTVNIELTAPFELCVSKGKDPTLDGTIRLGGYDMSYAAWSGSQFVIAAKLSGSGNVSTVGMAGTGSPHSECTFANDNSEWTGTLTMTQNANGDSIPGEATKCHQKLRLLNGNNLGGALPSFDPKALYLRNYSEIIVTNDVTLASGLNRGVAVSNAAIFNVAANCTLACNWPVTFCGTLIKNGAGTLALGARSLFLSAAGEVVETPDPTMPTNALRFNNGAIKVLAHNCLDGVTLAYGTDAKYAKDLILPFNPSDANLKQFGLYNVATDMPFDEGVTIKVSLADVDAAILAAERAKPDGYKQGLITVKATAAKNVEDNLVVEKVKGLRLIREDDAETGTTTFSLYGKKEGVLLLVR